MKPTDIRVREVYFDYEDFRYRSPIKFGGVALDRCTVLNVRIVVESGDGSRLPLVDSGEHRYASAEEAHRAGSSAAAAAIDRTRTTKGKP